MSERIKALAAGLNTALHSDHYRVEVDTEDIVFGFKKTIKKQAKSLATWLRMQGKTRRDVGRYLSDCVRIMEVRWYKNGQLIRTMTAEHN